MGVSWGHSGSAPVVHAPRWLNYDSILLPNRVGVVPSRVGVVPNRVGVAPNRVGVVPSRLGVVPSRVGVVPSTVGMVTFVVSLGNHGGGNREHLWQHLGPR